MLLLSKRNWIKSSLCTVSFLSWRLVELIESKEIQSFFQFICVLWEALEESVAWCCPLQWQPLSWVGGGELLLCIIMYKGVSPLGG